MFQALVIAVLVSSATSVRNEHGSRPPQSLLCSFGGNTLGYDEEHCPPIFRPPSQVYCDNPQRVKVAHEHWLEETSPRRMNTVVNCLLCSEVDRGACRAQPSCVYCERTVTALCEGRTPPCIRCTVIKNPFFRCSPGDKYMDECDTCRCVDGHSGWCTNQFCEFRPLYLYAMALSEGELYY